METFKVKIFEEVIEVELLEKQGDYMICKPVDPNIQRRFGRQEFLTLHKDCTVK